MLSCLLTLILCVWSALHLDVPHQDACRLDILLCNLRWNVTGVYAPELVVFTNRTLYNSTSLTRHRYKSTRTHEFFASTGGFGFEIPAGLDENANLILQSLPKNCLRRLKLIAGGGGRWCPWQNSIDCLMSQKKTTATKVKPTA